jgi:hypothetical protein
MTSARRLATPMLGALAMSLAVAVAFAVVLGGCTVGSGSGKADGTLFVAGCSGTGSQDLPPPYELKPTFFAGEPIEDICPPPGNCPGVHTNRLLIRMQRTGNRVEINDTLYFDIQNAFEVARCVRGKTTGGQPQWDTRFVSNPDGTLTTMPWCDWNAGAVGTVDAGTDAGAGGGDAGAPAAMTGARARINLSTADYVRASLAPLYTCVEARVVGVAAKGSWIEFQDFGLAAQPNIPDPEARDAVNSDFKVSFGQRLRALFHLELADQFVINAIKNRDPVPAPHLSGTLDGSFDFDLDRGRAAQQFP